jgi:hypothetical protein
MTRDKNGDVVISLYHVVDRGGIHRFRMTNQRFIGYLGGRDATEARLREQFLSVELLGTCPVRVGNSAGEGAVDVAASTEIVAKIKAIDLEHPGTDPLPCSWTEGEYQMDFAQAVFRTITNSSLEKEITQDLLQVQDMVADNIDGIVALIHSQGGLKASAVLRDAEKTGFRLTVGGAPAGRVSMITAADPMRYPGQWTTITSEELSVPLFPPGEDQPVVYLAVCPDGYALAYAGRRQDGQVTWSANLELIDGIAGLLADAGVLKETK